MAEQTIIVKKVIHKGHGHHGGSWKVAYADFVTAMMAFFLVMWLTSMSQDVKDQIQGYFNDPLGLAPTAPKSLSIKTMEGSPAPKPFAEKPAGKNAFKQEQGQLQSIEKKIKDALGKDPEFKNLMKGVKISITQEGLLIEFMEAKGAVFFESGSSIIRPEAQKLMRKISPILSASKHPVDVQGHTDVVPYAGDKNGNFRLSTERALSLQEVLEDSGMPDSQFVGVKGFGSTRLLDPANPISQVNRRVTILLPRKYTQGDKEAAPSDDLASQIRGETVPQAVVVKPGAIDLQDKGSP
ncbi:MAG TPA: flagellar motor protein MotB [Fimbriimonas sp.]|nr:flagellar motor protein MotB [Fimbriimonas sp.]